MTRLAVAVIALALYLALGAFVSARSPGAFDLATASATFDVATPLAALCTAAGRFPAYLAVCIVVLLAGIVRRAILPYSLTSIALLLIAMETSDALKLVFHRSRPTLWIVTHESSWSYSSGHATLSLTFYGFCALVALRSRLPRGTRIAIASALVSWIAAIGWSRLALGAHYATDVVGGYLLALAFLALCYPLARIRASRKAPAGSSTI